MSNARKFAGNTMALTIASLSTIILGAGYRILIANYIGDEEFGKYIFITTYVAYFASISLLGLRQVIVREVARAPEQHRPIFSSCLKIRVVSTVIAFILACVIVPFTGKGFSVYLGVFIYALSMFFTAVMDLAEGMLVGKESARYITISALVTNVTKVGVGIYLLYQGFGVIAILTLFTIMSVVNAALSWEFSRRVFKSVKTQAVCPVPNLTRFLFNESMPFFWLSLISKVYYKNDIIVLSLLKTDEVVGWYGAAYQLIDAILIVAMSIAAAAYPVMSRLYQGDDERLRSFHNNLSRYILVFFLPIALSCAAAGPELIRLLFRDQFSSASPVLPILAWMPPAEAVTVLMGTLLGATYKQQLTVRLSIIAATINLSLCLSLIPRYSYMGAAYGTTIAVYLNMMLVMYVVHRKLHRIDILNTVIKPLVCAGFTYAVMKYYLITLGPWGAMTTSIIVFILIAILTRTIVLKDYYVLLSIVRKSHLPQVDE